MGMYEDAELKKKKIPSIAVSEEEMAKDAQEAISYLERRNIDDLYEALGLTPYLKVVTNG